MEEVIRYPKFNTNEAAEEHLRKSSTFSRIIPKIGRIFNPNFELMHEINKFAINKEKMMDRLQPLRNKNLWINRESFFWQGIITHSVTHFIHSIIMNFKTNFR